MASAYFFLFTSKFRWLLTRKGNLGFVQSMFAMYWTTPEVLPAISKRGAFVGNNILEYTEKNRDTVKRSTLKCNTMVVQQCENIYKYGCC